VSQVPRERRVVVRRAVWVLLLAAVGFAAGLAAREVRPPMYASTTVLTVNSDRAQELGYAARAAQAAARMATTRDLVSGPLAEAGQAEAAQDPRLHVRVQAAPNAPLITVTGLDPDPEDARRTAEAVAGALTGSVTVGPFRVTQLSAAVTPDAPQTSGWVLPLGFAGAIGGAAAAVALVLPVRARVRPDPRTARAPTPAAAG
jgi:hypothetical protein